MLKTLFTLIYLLSSPVQAEQSLNRPTTKPVCLEEVKRCEYLTANITGHEFVKRVENQLFPRQSIFFTKESYIEVQSGNTVVFWFEDRDIFNMFIALIPSIDALESFKPSDMVKVTTEILEMTEIGLKNFQAQITAVTARTSGSPRDISGDIYDADAGTISLNIPFKTVDLSVLLGASKVKKYTRKAITVVSYVNNFDSINYAHTTFVPLVGPSGILEKKTGVEIDGSVSIERSNNNLVKLNNFDLKYSQEVINPVDPTQMSINTLDVEKSSLYLYKGLTQTAVKSVSSIQTTDRGLRLSGINRSSGEIYNKMLIMVRAETISHEDIARQAQRVANSRIQGEFTPEEVRNFSTDEIDLESVIKDIRPFAKFSPTGERIIGFKLNSENARLDNYKRVFDIKISGAGLKQQANRTIEDLMTRGISFDEISESYYDRKYIKLKIKFKEFKKAPTRGHRRLRKSVTLYYNPQTNEFI